jgi:hypothetical protein
VCGYPEFKKVKLPVVSLCTAILISACASTDPGQNARSALYQNNAGTPTASFTYSRDNLQWRVLSDNSLAVWIQPDQASLVEFRNGCPNLRWAREISISNSNKTVTAGVDSVRILSPLPDRKSCKISTIRPLNLQAINDGRRDLREAQMVERSSDGTTE